MQRAQGFQPDVAHSMPVSRFSIRALCSAAMVQVALGGLPQPVYVETSLEGAAVVYVDPSMFARAGSAALPVLFHGSPGRTGRGGGAARGDGGPTERQGLHPHRAIAWHVLPVYPRRRCHYEGDRRTRRETLQSARCAPLRAKMYRMCRRPLASFSKCTEDV